MRRWLRIATVASAATMLLGTPILWFREMHSLDEIYIQQMSSCSGDIMNTADTHVRDQCVNSILDVEKRETWYQLKTSLVLVLITIIVGWLLGSVLVFTGRWVMRGT